MNKLLKDAPPGKYFYTHNGMIIKNLDELAVALELMDAEVFEYHVKDEKNDFSNWTDYILEEHNLARELIKVKSKNASAVIVRKHIEKLSFLRNQFGLVVGPCLR